jgi:hypothetical protein
VFHACIGCGQLHSLCAPHHSLVSLCRSGCLCRREVAVGMPCLRAALHTNMQLWQGSSGGRELRQGLKLQVHYVLQIFESTTPAAVCQRQSRARVTCALICICIGSCTAGSARMCAELHSFVCMCVAGLCVGASAEPAVTSDHAAAYHLHVPVAVPCAVRWVGCVGRTW